MKKRYFIIMIALACLFPMIVSAKEPTQDDRLAIEDRAPAKLLPAVAYRYNEKIPYDVGGRFWGLGFKMHSSFDNSSFFWTGSGDGLDSEGYVLWLIRQCFGYSPEEIRDNIHTEKMEEVSYNSLKVGDICVKDGVAGKIYGVVVCFKKDKPVVTVCDSQKTDDFVCGCSHFCYARDEDGFFDGYRPIDFTKFFRMPSKWD